MRRSYQDFLALCDQTPPEDAAAFVTAVMDDYDEETASLAWNENPLTVFHMNNAAWVVLTDMRTRFPLTAHGILPQYPPSCPEDHRAYSDEDRVEALLFIGLVLGKDLHIARAVALSAGGMAEGPLRRVYEVAVRMHPGAYSFVPGVFASFYRVCVLEGKRRTAREAGEVMVVNRERRESVWSGHPCAVAAALATTDLDKDTGLRAVVAAAGGVVSVLSAVPADGAVWYAIAAIAYYRDQEEATRYAASLCSDPNLFLETILDFGIPRDVAEGAAAMLFPLQ